MRKTPLRRRSASKARSDKQYAASRAVVAERAQGRCEAAVADACTGRHEHTHHVRLRSQGGSHDPANLRALCNDCHTWVHRNPAAAAALGLIELTTSEPPSTAVLAVSRMPYDFRNEV